MTTVFGSAMPCSRAARFGVSPTTASLLRLARSDQVADDDQARWRCRRGFAVERPTSARPPPRSAPARPAPLARRRPRALADSQSRRGRRRPCISQRNRQSAGQSRRRILIGGNDLAQVLRVHAGGERRRTDQVREHHRDLAALSASCVLGSVAALVAFSFFASGLAGPSFAIALRIRADGRRSIPQYPSASGRRPARADRCQCRWPRRRPRIGRDQSLPATRGPREVISLRPAPAAPWLLSDRACRSPR